MIDKAILKINPSAIFSVSAKKEDRDNVDKSTIEWLDGTTPISKADIKAKISELETAKANEETAKENAKVSGNQKLLDLGLSQAECTALTGYTPPVAE
jgi:hypothetical protein